ncbi:WD repeat-containing protein 73 isoform X2 [Alligator mississippiensis]|uniref:WD repeat-containing protein 73 isoform X2 n=1 Tax=Alligator mississippiensis TaxID=8496 RepID=UPI002877B2A2|nr:WD repeat-containing protein 73 isoform X2 [Alligator mississippiensis]
MAAPMERQQEEKEEEEEEDWVLDSLGLYEDLHVFDLQEPTRVLEWTRGPSICVAGYGGSGGDGRSEILQLGLPPRLCAREKQGLCPERDFKVERGGFSRRPVHGLKQVPDTGLLVTSGPPDSSLQVWQMAAEDTDVIHFVSTIPAGNASEKSWAKIATAFAGNPWVLHGSRVSNVQVTEIESKRSIYKAGTAQLGGYSAATKSIGGCTRLIGPGRRPLVHGRGAQP